MIRWQWELKVTKHVMVPFLVGRYTDEVTCDVVSIQAGHLLLRRQRQFNKSVMYKGKR